MLFPTTTFALFFALVLPLSWLTMPDGRRWRPFIVLASFVFYSWWDWRFVLLLGGSIVLNQVFAVRIHRARRPSLRKRLLIVALAANVGLLAYFKYYDFFVSSSQNLLSLVGLDMPLEIRSVVLPVGISFYTFMAISYVVDVYRGEFEPVSSASSPPTSPSSRTSSPGRSSGRGADSAVRPAPRPAPRRHEPGLLPDRDGPVQEGRDRQLPRRQHRRRGLRRPRRRRRRLEILVGVYAYAVQIYADFSGYTDIAIGLALLLGFRFPQNFDSPYAATSVQDFWRRWHMTLSRWLRDYVYIPLGGNRGGALLTYRNLMLTMLIGGLWHGAGWTFVAWGAIHGVGLVAERWWRTRPGYVAPPDTARRRAWHRFLTFQFVCFAWIFFRSDSFETASELLRGLVTGWGEASPLVTPGVLLAIAVGIGSQYLPPRIPQAVTASFSRLPVLGQAGVLALALMLTHAMGPEGVAPFIYFRF